MVWEGKCTRWQGYTWSMENAPIIVEANCIGCQACVIACPYSVLDMDDRNLAVVVAPDRCTRFNACADVCPTDAVILPWRSSADTAE